MIEKIIKIFIWLRDKNSPDLDMIRVYKVEGDIITFAAYWYYDDDEDGWYTLDTSKIITEGKINPSTGNYAVEYTGEPVIAYGFDAVTSTDSMVEEYITSADDEEEITVNSIVVQKYMPPKPRPCIVVDY